MEGGASIIVSMAKAAYNACLAAQRYQNEAARIGILLTWIVARAEKWQAQVGSPGTFDPFYIALKKIYICMEGTGENATKNRRCWYQRFTTLFSSQDLLTNILSAENELNRVITILNLELTSELLFLLNQGSKLECQESVADRLTSYGNTKSEIDCNKTIAQEMNQTLKICHEISPHSTVSTVSMLAFEQDEEIGHGNIKEQGHQVAFHNPTEKDLNSITICPTQITYNEEDILGIGGFAEVFRGTYHNKNGETRVVAVKRLKVDSLDLRYLSNQQRAHDAKQLATEAWLAYTCSVHKHVVEIIGCQTSFNSRDRPFIVMELLRTTLFDALHHYKDLKLLEMPLSYARRFHLMKGIAGALEFLHLRGVVHHDIKSANILLDEDMTVAKLSDFGEAKVKGLLYTTKVRQEHSTISPTSRQAVAVAGTVAYLAPEILTEDVTETSRVCEMYSFGVTVWECLTDEIPHKGKAEYKVANLASKKNHGPMLHVPSKPLSIDLSKEEINAWEALKAVALPCLSRDRKLRPTASQVVAIWNNQQPLHVLEEDLPVAGVPMNIASAPTTPAHAAAAVSAPVPVPIPIPVPVPVPFPAPVPAPVPVPALVPAPVPAPVHVPALVPAPVPAPVPTPPGPAPAPVPAPVPVQRIIIITMILVLAIVIIIIIAFVAGPTPPPPPNTPGPTPPPTPNAPTPSVVCELCGPGREVGDPDFVIVFEEETRLTCGELQTAGLQGFLNTSECSELVSFFESEDPCQCEDRDEDSPVTSPSPNMAPVTSPSPNMAPITSPSPNMAPAPSPSETSPFPTLGQPPTTVNNATDTASDSPSDIPSMAPGDGEPTTAQISMPSLMRVTAPDSALPTAAEGLICDICGPGREVGEPGKGIIFEGQSITCGQLQEFWQSGPITIDGCVSIISAFETDDSCSCQDEVQEPGTGETTPSQPPSQPPTSSATSLMYSFAVTAMAAVSTISLLLLN